MSAVKKKGFVQFVINTLVNVIKRIMFRFPDPIISCRGSICMVWILPLISAPAPPRALSVCRPSFISKCVLSMEYKKMRERERRTSGESREEIRRRVRPCELIYGKLAKPGFILRLQVTMLFMQLIRLETNSD